MNKILKMSLLLIVYGILSYGIFRIAKNLITKIPKTVDPISCTDSQKLNEKGDCVPVCDDNKIINDKTSPNCTDECMGDCKPELRCGCACSDPENGSECVNSELCPTYKYCKLANPNYIEYAPPPKNKTGKSCVYPVSTQFKNGTFEKNKNSTYVQGDTLQVTCDDKYNIQINKDTTKVTTDKTEIDLYCDDGSWNTSAVACVSTTKPLTTNWESPINITCCPENEICTTTNGIQTCTKCPNEMCDGICCKNGEKCGLKNGVQSCCGANLCGNLCCDNPGQCCTNGEVSSCCSDGLECNDGKCKIPCGKDFCDQDFYKCIEIPPDTDLSNFTSYLTVVKKRAIKIKLIVHRYVCLNHVYSHHQILFLKTLKENHFQTSFPTKILN